MVKTMTEQLQYPQNSVLAEMLIDIYASKSHDQITILHDKVFDTKLIKLELSGNGNQLDFILEDNSKRPLGSPVSDDLMPYFQNVDEVTFCLVDVETKKPLDGQIVPLEVKQ